MSSSESESDASRKRARAAAAPGSDSDSDSDAGPRRRPAPVAARREPVSYGENDSDLDQAVDELMPSDDEEEGVNLLEGAEGDYRPMEHQDNYDARMLDDGRVYGDMDMEDRLAAEAEIDQRRAQRQGRLDALLDDDDEEDQDDRRRRRRREDAAEGGEGDLSEDEDDEEGVNLEQFDVPLREWVATDRTRREIMRRFKGLLRSFTDASGNAVYQDRIHEMCAHNKQSLSIEFNDISVLNPTLAMWLADAPRDLLAVFDEVAKECVLELYPDYHRIHDEIHVRVAHLPCSDSLRDLRESHLDSLVSVYGVVTRRTGVFPQLKHVKFNCPSCSFVLGPFLQRSDKEIRPGACPECQSHGPFVMNSEQTVYRNYQKITLQESPGTVPPGRVPRHREVILLSDLIDSARPGEEVVVMGIYTHSQDSMLNSKQGFPVFSTVIEANNVVKKNDVESSHFLTEEDKAAVQELAKDPNIGRRIIDSIAPSIYGHDHVKLALAFSLFGGRAKDMNKKHRIRGDVNVLLLGDPGTAKSQFLKYAEKTAPRAVYTTGKGASAVGLTASVQKDPITKEWTLEGGALVLADRGVCLIDEFDKMNESDRTSIHEAMEQQSISISKAGIVTSLQARCSIIAAANPIGGRYDGSRTLAENVELTDPILQRFDVLCVLQDTVDPVADERLAEFVVGSHMRSHPMVRAAGGAAAAIAGGADADDEEDPAAVAAALAAAAPAPATIPQDLLRKYIQYARETVKPQLHNIDQDKIARLYADLRRESITSGGVPIAVRHIESIMRMSEAHARMHLRDHVRSDDTDMAIRVMLESFIQAQKFQVKRSLRRGFQKFLTFQRDHDELLLHTLQGLVSDAHKYLSLRHNRDIETVDVRADDLETRAREFEIYDIQSFYTSRLFSSHNFSYDVQTKTITKHF